MTCQPGDIVTVRGQVRRVDLPRNPMHDRLVVDFTFDHFVPLEHADIVTIEQPNYRIGDPVRVVPHTGAPWEGAIIGTQAGKGGEFFWVIPGVGQPCTVTRSELRRAPPEPKSADIAASEFLGDDTDWGLLADCLGRHDGKEQIYPDSERRYILEADVEPPAPTETIAASSVTEILE